MIKYMCCHEPMRVTYNGDLGSDDATHDTCTTRLYVEDANERFAKRNQTTGTVIVRGSTGGG